MDVQNLQQSHRREDKLLLPHNSLEFKTYAQHDHGRCALERQIAHTYQQNFDAKLFKLMPTLVCANRPGTAAHLFFGIRCAGEQKLFLENYLDEPVEYALARAMHGVLKPSRLNRNNILEIGNMVISDTSSIQDDLISIAHFCDDMGYQHVVCTATRMLRLIFLKLGMKPAFLGKARQKDAPDDGTRWGKYYESTPQIMGGNVLLSIRLLQRASRARQHRISK